MLYSTKQEEGAVLPKHMDLKFPEFMASADGGRSKRQMVNITSNIFILLRKAKQKTTAYEATQRIRRANSNIRFMAGSSRFSVKRGLNSQ